ncbi:MAG: hypothetical protein EOO65_02945 [Methanosarcinales archaeon]|nr:MAG: hypothetical protein EOO65_02945 [Methanosarcinales archaeon]
MGAVWSSRIVVGTGVSGLGTENVLANTSKLTNVLKAVGVPGDARLWVCDPSQEKVFLVRENQTIITLVGDGQAGESTDNVPGTSARLKSPQDIAVDDAGSAVWIADKDNYRIRKYNMSTGLITTVAGGGTSYTDDTLATSVQLNAPSAVVVSPDGSTMWIRSHALCVVYRVNSTGYIRIVAGMSGNCAYQGDAVLATSAKIDADGRIAVSRDLSTLCIADANNHRVRCVNSTGYINTVAGTGGSSSNGNNGAVSVIDIQFPLDVSIDLNGVVYFVERDAWLFRMVYNNFIQSIFGMRLSSYFAPAGLWMHPDGTRAVIAETTNYVVRELLNDAVPSPSPTASSLPTSSISSTTSRAPSMSGYATPSGTMTATPTGSGTASRTASSSASPSSTAATTGSGTASRTASSSASPSSTATVSMTQTGSPTSSATCSTGCSASNSPSVTPSVSISSSVSATPSSSCSPTSSNTVSLSPSTSASLSVTATVSPTASPTASWTASMSASLTPSASPSASQSSSTSASPSLTAAPSVLASSPTSSSTPAPSFQPMVHGVFTISLRFL